MDAVRARSTKLELAALFLCIHFFAGVAYALGAAFGWFGQVESLQLISVLDLNLLVGLISIPTVFLVVIFERRRGKALSQALAMTLLKLWLFGVVVAVIWRLLLPAPYYSAITPISAIRPPSGELRIASSSQEPRHRMP